MKGLYLILARTIESSRWAWLSAFCFLALVSFIVGLMNLNLTEDVVELIPQEDPELVENYQQLSEAPFSKKILISIEADPAGSIDIDALCDLLKQSLQKPFFFSSLPEISGESAQQVLTILNSHIHLLLTAEEMERVAGSIRHPEQFQRLYQQNLRELMSPEGVFLKDLILSDPLRLRDYSTRKLNSLGSSGFEAGQSGALLSRDRSRALLVMESEVLATDTRQIEAMIAHFDAVWNSIKPENASADWLSTHRYSHANSSSIKKDINRIMVISLLLIGCVFLYFFRDWRSFLLLLGPGFVFAYALGALALSFQTVSSISIGFASILIAISIDYSIHVFMHTRTDTRCKYETLWGLVSPLSMSLLTTILAFAVLLLSSLKIHREFAVFCIAGLLAAFVFSVFILPAFLASKPTIAPARVSEKRLPRFSDSTFITGWAIVLLGIAMGIPQIKLSTESTDLYIVPQNIRNLEQSIDRQWGHGLRRSTLYYVQGEDLETALRKNDELFANLGADTDSGDFISIHTILPSVHRQQHQFDLWKATFCPELIHLLEQRLESVQWPKSALTAIHDRVDKGFKPLTSDHYTDTFVSAILEDFIVQRAEQIQVFTLSGFQSRHLDQPPVNHFPARELSAANISRKMNAVTINQFRNLVMTTLLAVLGCAFILLRNRRLYLSAMLPMLTGLTCVAGYLGWTQTPVTFFHAAAALLIIGLGVDYGILITKMQRSNNVELTIRSIWISSLTTIAGFIGLMFAAHPFLKTIGIDVSIGIFAATLTAVGICPRLLKVSTPTKQ